MPGSSHSPSADPSSQFQGCFIHFPLRTIFPVTAVMIKDQLLSPRTTLLSTASLEPTFPAPGHDLGHLHPSQLGLCTQWSRMLFPLYISWSHFRPLAFGFKLPRPSQAIKGRTQLTLRPGRAQLTGQQKHIKNQPSVPTNTSSALKHPKWGSQGGSGIPAIPSGGSLGRCCNWGISTLKIKLVAFFPKLKISCQDCLEGCSFHIRT